MKVLRVTTWVLGTLLLAGGRTVFHLYHETLPRAVRASSSLMLAPVAVVDGLCYAVGIPGVYGKVVPVFLINWVFVSIVAWVVLRFHRWWRTEPTG